MAFDDQTRRRLFKTVTACRNLLTEDFDEQLRSRFGIYAEEGKVLELDRLTGLDDAGREIARVLRERIDHLSAGKGREALGEAVHRLRREQAFTVLNRFAAVRMAEERDLISQSVGAGMQSRGFRVFEQAVGGAALGDQYERYRVYLDCLFDELSLDLGVLFDRADAMGLLFPGEQALRDLFDELNHPDIAPLWPEDETIGWIYQYYNDPEERKRMRKESAAPRNSRELAVRNQFFTPRYVVEFLTDNTLGRIWYEMTKGQTRLTDQCRYLVRRPLEFFLAEGETAPEIPDREGLSQEDLLKQPAHIPHRPLKDPREIRFLDPACGSMHFGLYAFDLFETIYAEAWDNVHCPALRADYASKDEYLRDVPRLIIEHNIHGIDIDPRAVQIAGLSLWLRAQKTWKDQGVKAADRPQVRRSNIVCAEPMPGSPEMLEEFVATLESPLLGELLKTVFEKMQLAGEAGSLLKIEQEIRSAIDSARKEWLKQRDDLLTRHDGSQEMFFDSAEQHVLDALRAYSEQTDADSCQRRLFADDAARGFAFIDLCRKRFDAVVMNPPFGEATTSKSLGTYLKKNYPSYAKNIACSMMLRGLDLAHQKGELGIIVDRSLFYRKKYAEVRKAMLDVGAFSFLDLGWGVLDSANVEVSAIAIEKSITYASAFIDLRHEENKDSALGRKLASLKNPELQRQAFIHSNSEFSSFPNSAFVYWVPNSALKLFDSTENFAKSVATTKQGTAPADTPRFVRLYWEIPPISFIVNDFARLGHGGSFSPYFRDYYFAIEWRNFGETLKAYVCQRYPYLDGNPAWVVKNEKDYMRRGVHYGKRCNCLNVQLFPEGMVFTNEGHVVFPYLENSELLICGLLNSQLYRYMINTYCGQHKHGGYVDKLPRIDIPAGLQEKIENSVSREWMSRAKRHQIVESSNWFVATNFGDEWKNSTLREAANLRFRSEVLDDAQALRHRLIYESELASVAGITPADWGVLQNAFGEDPSAVPSIHPEDPAENSESEDDETVEAPHFSIEQYGLAFIKAKQLGVSIDRLEDEHERLVIDEGLLREHTNQLQSYFVGAALGRWDLRFATGERQPPELPDPFAPLPACPPGMLQNSDGLPAAREDVPADYPLRITWPGILVDEENHPEDIVARVREALRVVWGDRADDIESEACEILGVKAKPKESLDALRVYFRDPNRFFKDHLARYSKSRRKAPIYWPLSTESGSYTLWIYYHRLDSQTLYTCVSEFIDPKREALGRDLEVLGRRIGTGGSTEERQQLDELTAFLTELKTLRDRLLEVAGLPYRPNLNDGVQITAAPLWKCFRHGPWQKVLKDTWKELEKGKYDWAHLALPIWPGRVVPLCAKDRSLAIAHGLENLLWVPDLSGKKKDQLRPLKSPDDEINELIKAGHDKKDVDRATSDVDVAETLGLRDHLWVEVPVGTWRRRLGPKEEIENEVARIKGR